MLFSNNLSFTRKYFNIWLCLGFSLCLRILMFLLNKDIDLIFNSWLLLLIALFLMLFSGIFILRLNKDWENYRIIALRLVVSITDTYVFFVNAFIIISVMSCLLFKIGLVSGFSMYPTFESNDLVIVNVTSSAKSSLKVGDIIAVKSEDGFVVKRLWGVEGDTISYTTDSFSLNGEVYTYDDTFAYSPKSISFVSNSFTLGTNEFFIMGDNFKDSKDSRVYGAVTGDNILGKVVYNISSLSKTSNTPIVYILANEYTD